MNLATNPAVLLWLTITVFWIANILRMHTGNVLFNPVVVSTAVLIVYLKVLGIDYQVYHHAGQFIDFWLKPAVVALAVPLYLNWEKIRKQWLLVLCSQLVGSITGIVTGVGLAKMMGASPEVVISIASKSVTNPIAIEITKSVNGIPAITAATVILAGMMGQMAGYRLMKASAVHKQISQSISLGTASHAMGIAAALEIGKKFAAYASLGLIFNGILTAFLVPILLPLMGVK